MSAPLWVVSIMDDDYWLVGPFASEAEATAAARDLRRSGLGALPMPVDPYKPVAVPDSAWSAAPTLSAVAT